MYKTVETSKIEFIESSHTYLLDGVIIPSVSQIIADDSYLGIPPHILENAAKRGTAVHLASEMIDLGKKPKLDSSFAEWVVQYALFKLDWIENNPDLEWLDIETILYTDEFAGTVDRVAYLNERLTIIDVKTTSKLYKEKIALQLGGYAYAYAKMNNVSEYRINGGVIWLTKNSWKYVEITPNVDGFLEKLKEYKEREVVSEINW